MSCFHQQLLLITYTNPTPTQMRTCRHVNTRSSLRSCRSSLRSCRYFFPQTHRHSQLCMAEAAFFTLNTHHVNNSLCLPFCIAKRAQTTVLASQAVENWPCPAILSLSSEVLVLSQNAEPARKPGGRQKTLRSSETGRWTCRNFAQQAGDFVG